MVFGVWCGLMLLGLGALRSKKLTAPLRAGFAVLVGLSALTPFLTFELLVDPSDCECGCTVILQGIGLAWQIALVSMATGLALWVGRRPWLALPFGVFAAWLLWTNTNRVRTPCVIGESHEFVRYDGHAVRFVREDWPPAPWLRSWPPH